MKGLGACRGVDKTRWSSRRNDLSDQKSFVGEMVLRVNAEWSVPDDLM
jgi:hypothetical protein